MNKNTKKEEKKITNNGYTTKSPLFISLCLGNIIDGLHIDFCVVKEGKDQVSCIVPTFKGKTIGFFELEWLEDVNPKDGALCVDATLRLNDKSLKNKHG